MGLEGGTENKEEETEEEKIPHRCESIGHRSLWRVGGRRRRMRRTRRKRKVPMCVKALVIEPFGAAAQKGSQSNKLHSLNIENVLKEGIKYGNRPCPSVLISISSLLPPFHAILRLKRIQSYFIE